MHRCTKLDKITTVAEQISIAMANAMLAIMMLTMSKAMTEVTTKYVLMIPGFFK